MSANTLSKFLPLYTFSKILPIHMQSCYDVCIESEDESITTPECSTWWQWRGRIWNHKVFNEKVGW